MTTVSLSSVRKLCHHILNIGGLSYHMWEILDAPLTGPARRPPAANDFQNHHTTCPHDDSEAKTSKTNYYGAQGE